MEPNIINSPTSQEVKTSSSSKQWILLFFFSLFFFLVGSAGGFIVGREQKNSPNVSVPPQNNSACTMDAKICPDGSAVGRTGPHCEFAACPDSTAQQKTINNLSISYPEGFELINKTETEMYIGAQGITYLTIRKDFTIDPYSLIVCEKTQVFPCLSNAKNWNKSKNIETITVGGKPAISFYMTTGTVDSDERVVQVEQEIEARMNVAGGGLDAAFEHMIASMTFTN